jgi:hypothetical protein
MDRLTAHTSIRITVKMVPMINPSGRSTQLSSSVYANTRQRIAV